MRELGHFCDNCQKQIKAKLVSRNTVHKFRKETFKTTENILMCECGHEVYDEEIDNQLMEKLVKLYERRVGLNKEDIKKIRENANLSMELFSRILGWSKATIVRYEKGQYIPDVSHQSVLKMIKNSPKVLWDFYEDKKTSFSSKEQSKIENALSQFSGISGSMVSDVIVQYQTRNDYPNIQTGFSHFDFDKVVNMVLFFSDEGVNKTKLMKCLFFSDFLNFKRYTNSISGLRYVKLKFGPVPEKHNTLLDEIEEGKNINVESLIKGEYEHITVTAIKEFDKRIFNQDELDVLNFIAEEFKNYGASGISDFSHNEEGWIQTPDKGVISYKFANSLQLD